MTAPRLAALAALADLDAAIDQRRHRLGNLAERQAQRDVEGRLAGAETQRREAVAVLDEVASRQGVLEADLSSAEARIGTIEGRMYGGLVSAGRDLQALADEVTALRSRVSRLEDRILEVLDERQPLDDRIAELDATRGALAAELTVAAERSAAAEGSLHAELSELGRRRAEVAATVDEELSALYERLRSRLGGVGAARLVGDRCAGCHLTLPATELDRLRHQPPDAIVTCEQCGRILVRA